MYVINNLFLRLLLSTLFVFSFVAHGSMYAVNVYKSFSGDAWLMHVSLANVAPPLTGVIDYGVSRPKCGVAGYVCAYGLVYENGSKTEMNRYANVYINDDQHILWADADAKFRAQYGSSFKFSSYASSAVLKCARMGIQRENGTFINAPGISGQCSTVLEINQCEIRTTTLNLNHGNVALKDLDNHMAEGVVNVVCSTPVNVIFSSDKPDGNVLMKDGQIRSHLTVADKELGETISMPSELTQIAVKSTLHVEKTLTGGAFSGSQTLIINVI